MVDSIEYRIYKDLLPASGSISIAGGGGDCPDALIEINLTPFANALSGSVLNISVFDKNLNTYQPYLSSPNLIIAKERRQDWQPPYSYCGIAQYLSSEAANVWKIARITVNNDGTTTVGYANNVNWTDRYTHTYNP
jgi:hypothetical protein